MKTTLVPYMIFEEKDLIILRGACSLASSHSAMTETQEGFKDMFSRINIKLLEISTARAARKSLRADKRAVTALEYALIAALIGVVIVSSVASVGTAISSTFNTVKVSIAGAK